MTECLPARWTEHPLWGSSYDGKRCFRKAGLWRFLLAPLPVSGCENVSFYLPKGRHLLHGSLIACAEEEKRSEHLSFPSYFSSAFSSA